MSFNPMIIPQIKEKQVANDDLRIARNAHFGSGELWTAHKGVWKGKEVVIKETRYSPLTQPKGTVLSEAGLSEFRPHCQLAHPNIVSYAGVCLSFGNKKVEFAVITESSKNLFTWMKENPKRDEQTSFEEVLIAEGAAKGLSHLHSKKIRHGQIHPGNILVDQHLNAKMDDYDLMTLRSGVRFEYYPGAEASRECYLRRLAPEMLNKSGRQEESVYMPADVYALGVTILEMVSRKAPFAGVSIYHVEKFLKVNETPEIPDDLNMHCLTPLLKRCIALDPADRPTANEMAEELGKTALNFRKVNFAKALTLFLRNATPVFVNAEGKKHAAITYITDRIKDPISLILGFAEQLDEKRGALKLS